MAKLGIFTGHIYKAKESPLECCVVIDEKCEKSVWIQNKIYFDKHKNCKGCFGCPESRKETQSLRNGGGF